MTITSVGYEGEINEQRWAELAPLLGSPYAIVGPNDWAVTSVAGQDRTISIAPGVGWGHGVRVTSDAPESIQLPSVASGSRWDLIACNRDWTPVGGGVSTFVSRQGNATQAIPSTRKVGPGTTDDQPIALVQVTAGQTLPTAIVPLRTWASKVLTADSLLAIPDAPYGTEAVVGGVRYRRVKDSTGTVAWTVDDTGWLSGTKLPLTWAAGWVDNGSRIRRKDGWIEAYFAAKRTGATLIADDVHGNLLDTVFATVNSSYRPSTHNMLLASYYATTRGSFSCGTLAGPNGGVLLFSGMPGVDLAKNDMLYASGTWLAA